VIIARIVRRLVGGTARGMLRRWPTTLLALALLIGGVSALGSRGLVPGLPQFSLGDVPGFEVASPQARETREMTIEALRPVRGGEEIELVLKEKSGNRRLVMSTGIGEAAAIAGDLNTRRGDRPTTLTYDLMRSLVQELGGTVNHVVVNNVNETTFFAKVVMTADNRQIEVDSRPSDAIALALRAKAPILADVSVLDKAGVLSPN
jgi:bifunctional DNase/RNase